MPALGFEGDDAATPKRQELIAGCPIAPGWMNGKQGHDLAGGEPCLADQVQGFGESAAGVGRLVKKHGESASLGAVRKPRALPPRDAFLRTNGHRIHVLIALGVEIGAQERREVRTHCAESHDHNRSLPVRECGHQCPAQR